MSLYRPPLDFTTSTRPFVRTSRNFTFCISMVYWVTKMMIYTYTSSLWLCLHVCFFERILHCHKYYRFFIFVGLKSGWLLICLMYTIECYIITNYYFSLRHDCVTVSSPTWNLYNMIFFLLSVCFGINRTKINTRYRFYPFRYHCLSFNPLRIPYPLLVFLSELSCTPKKPPLTTFTRF